MRLESLLFVVVLFACVNTSSTSSISTTVRSLTSNQEDVAAHGVGVGTTEEERMLNIFEFDKPIEGVNDLLSKSVKKLISYRFKDYGKEVEAYKSLRLDKENNKPRKIRYNAWLNYLAEKAKLAPFSKTNILRSKELEKNKILMKLFTKFSKEKSLAIFRAKVMSLLTHSWTVQELSSHEVFMELELDVMPPLDHSVYIDRLEMWYHHMQNTQGTTYEDAIVDTINKFDNDVRVMILGSLRKVKDTNMDYIESRLLSSLKKSEVSVKEVFEKLNLHHVYDKAYFIVWVKYVVKVIDNLKPEEKKVATGLFNVHGIEGLGKILVALAINDVGKDLQPKLMSKVVATWKTDKTWQYVLSVLEENEEIFKSSVMNDLFGDLKKKVNKEFSSDDSTV